MKKIITLISFTICSTGLYSQITYDNSCSEDVPLIFMDNGRAQDAFEEHGKPGLYYLNLLLNDNGLKYKGQRLGEIEELKNVFEKPKRIADPKTFEVVIGLERSAPMEYFKRLICELKALGTHNIDSIYVYFYSNG